MEEKKYITKKTCDNDLVLIFCVLLTCEDVVHHSICDVERYIVLLDGRNGDPVLSPLHVKLWYTSLHSRHNVIR